MVTSVRRKCFGPAHAVALTVLVSSLTVLAPTPASAAEPTEITSRPASDIDDAEEFEDGTMYRYSSDLELINDGTVDQTVGIRFPSLDVPNGATVVNARIDFVVDETDSEPTTLDFRAHAIDDAPPFASTSFDISTRPVSAALMQWADVDPWLTVGAVVSTPDLSSVVQEIVDRPGWAPGNALAIIVTGSGHRTAGAHTDGSAAAAPTLVVSYTVSKPAIVDPGTQTNNVGDSVDLPIQASDPDGDPLTYSASGLPAGLGIDPATGVISGTIADGAAGGYTVTVEVSDGTETASTSFSWVVVDPSDPTTTFAVIGDYGIQNEDEGDVADLIDTWNVDFVATLGDNSYSRNFDANVGQFYHEYIHPYIGTYGAGSPDVNRFFPALGNHDWDFSATISCTPSGDCSGEWFDYFDLPGNERYYDVVWGPVHLFVIDSFEAEPDGTTADSVQAQWLQSALAASTSPWRLVLFHHTPYTSGNINGSTESMRWPFEEWGATAVLAGHEHVYERLTIGNIPYFVNGLGGAASYSFGSPIPGSEARYAGDFGAMRIQAGVSTITYEFINRSGELIDTYSMATGPPAGPAAPVVESGPADPTESTDAVFVFGSSTPGVTYQCRLDGGLFESCGSPVSYAGLAVGSHTFEVKAVDGDGVESSVTSYSWTITEPPLTYPYPTAVVADGPSGYWRLGDIGTTTVTDETGNSSGSYENGVILGVDGALESDPDTAARFLGSRQKISIDGVDVASGDFTIEFWMRSDSATSGFIIGQRAGQRLWHIEVLESGQIRMTLRERRTEVVVDSIFTAAHDGQWHHIVVTVDRDEGIGLHVDGQVDRLAPAGIGSIDLTGLGALEIGQIRGMSDYFGDLDEVAVYSFVLAESDIAEHHGAAFVG